MEPANEILEDNRKYGNVEFQGVTYYLTGQPWFDRFDDRAYWWMANAIDAEGNDYLVQWAFDLDLDPATMPWDEVFGVEPA